MTESGTKSIPLGVRKKRKPHQIPEVVPREGMRLGRYELVMPLARGGMAEVWIARLVGGLGFSRPVAWKTIRPEYSTDPGFRAAFLEEARIAARLRHTNVVEVLDLGEEGSILFLAMTLVEGDSLRMLLRSMDEAKGEEGASRLPPSISLRIMIDALAGLHAAHELCDEHGTPMQLVHRDVSPQNILVGLDGVSKLTDFGVAKALGRISEETEAGQLRGKLGYLAPEQVERRPLDRRADIFAAGVVLWELLAGRRLFKGTDLMETINNIVKSAAPPLSSVANDIPEPIDRVVAQALMRDPSQRPSSAAEMADALERAAVSGGLVLASAREVGAFVDSVCGERVAERRRVVEGVIEAGERKAKWEEPTGTPSEPPPQGLRATIGVGVPQPRPDTQSEAQTQMTMLPPPATHTGDLRLQKRLRALLMVAALGGAILAVALAASSPPRAPRPSSVVPGESASPTLVEPSEQLRPPPTGEEPRPGTDTPVLDAPRSRRGASASRSSARRLRSSPKPKFDNPYER